MLSKLIELSNIEFEKQILGTILRNPTLIYDLPGFFNDNLFFNEDLKSFYKMIIKMEIDGALTWEAFLPDIPLCLKYMRDFKLSPVLLNELINGSSDHNFSLHLHILKELQMKRKLYQITNKCISNIDTITDVNDLISDLNKGIYEVENFSIRQNIDIQNHIEIHKKLLAEKIKLKQDGGSYAISTGFAELDANIVGWLPNDLVVIGARPSMGKTAIALQFLYKCSTPSLFLSLEMDSNSLIDRFILGKTEKIDSYNLRNGNIDDIDLQEIEYIYTELNNHKIYIDDFSEENSNKHIESIRIKIKTYIKKHDIKIVIIDYLGLINHSEKDNNIGFGLATKVLKQLCKELKITIILLHQLNRGVESRGNKRPFLSDLRDSGEIEQDADIVMFLYRDDYYEKPELEYKKNELEIIISKQRQGALNTVILKHNETLTNFYGENESAINEFMNEEIPINNSFDNNNFKTPTDDKLPF